VLLLLLLLCVLFNGFGLVTIQPDLIGLVIITLDSQPQCEMNKNKPGDFEALAHLSRLGDRLLPLTTPP
jgi:hypothetical protein